LPFKKSMKFVSVESPFNSKYPWIVYRNIQYAIQANTHASFTDVTWTPHIVNTQYVKFGMDGYISDFWAIFLSTLLTKSDKKYFIGRDETLNRTNEIRRTKIDKIICYTDYGISSGMQQAIDIATECNIPIEYRTLPYELKKDIFGESFISTIVPIAKFGIISALIVKGFCLL